MEVTGLLTKFCYKNPSMFCSAIIREDSTFFRDTQLDNVQREKVIGIVNLRWDISVKSLASRLRILYRKGRRIITPNGYGRHQGSITFHILTHMWTHRDPDCMHRAWTGSRQSGVQCWEEKMGTIPVPNWDAICNWQVLTKEKLALVLFLNEVLLGI